MSALFHPLTTLRGVWAGIRMECTLWLRSMIWSIGPTIVYMILMLILAVTTAQAGETTYLVLSIVLELLYTLVMIAVQVKVQSYMAGWLLLVDNDMRGAWAATRETAEVFRGNLGRLFLFDLSFIGWYLLTAAVLGGCVLLGAAGFMMLPSFALRMAVVFAVGIAAFCLLLVLNGFLTAYMQTAFFGMYEQMKVMSMQADGMSFDGTPFEP